MDDTRGILHPGRMRECVKLERYPVAEPLEGLIDWFWSVRWAVPDGESFTQDVASHPGVNLSLGVAPPTGNEPHAHSALATGNSQRWVLNGVTTGVARRVLRGEGWNVAAKTTTGGFGAWVDDVATLTDCVLDGSDAIAVANILPSLRSTVAREASADNLAGIAHAIGDELVRLLAHRSDARIREARDVARIARFAEHDRSVRRVDDLARAAGVSARTLQRRFASCAGVSPTWVIRRFRLLDAAELVRDGDAVDWADVAATLGYADQAHLVRDFRATIGQSPAAYARAQRTPLQSEA